MGKKTKNSSSSRPAKRGSSSGGAPNIRKGKIVEEVVALLHEEPGVKIETNVKLPPKHGGDDPTRRREIDVLITGQVAGYTVRMAFSCKNERLPIKPNLIDEFIGTLDDVGIPPEQGIFVCVNGYSSGALARAKDKGITTLVLRGLTKSRLASEITKAFQFTVHLLPMVTRITVTNDNGTASNREQFLVFGNEKQELYGTVLDLIVDRWRKGDPPSTIGEYELNLDIPKGWRQFVAGAPVKVMAATCKVKVVGLVIELTGKTKQHSLVDPVENIVKRSRVDVSFDMPKLGRSLPLRAFESEQGLKKFLERRSAVRISSRIRLPRIRCGDVYWPLSERVGKLLVTAANDRNSDRQTFAGVEGTDLSSAWEKPWQGLFKLGPPVLATDIDGNFVDVRLLMEQEDFAAVIALQTEFENHPSEEFAHLLAWANYLQGLSLFEKAESSNDDKNNRLLRLAGERFQWAIHIKPDFPEAYKTLGKTLRDLGEFEEAVRAYDKAMALNPADFEGWADRAAPLINQSQFDQAVESATTALQRATNVHSRAYALATRAAAYHFAGQPNEAVTDLTDAWKTHSQTIVESLGAHALYERICVAEPSAEAVLLLAEMRWTKAVHHAANNEVEEANKWNELAGQTLESLTTKESDNLVWSGSLSNQLIDDVLIRTAARFQNDRALQTTIVTRMQSWIVSVLGEESEALNASIGVGEKDHSKASRFSNSP